MAASVNEATVTVRIHGRNRLRRDKNFSALAGDLLPLGQGHEAVHHLDHLHFPFRIVARQEGSAIRPA